MIPQLCVGAVAVSDDQLLMIRRATPPSAGRWSLPGGRVELGESLSEAVVRELREETGLSGVCGALVGWVELIDDDHHFVVLDFEVTVLSPEAPQAGSDASDACWVPCVDVAELSLVDGLAEFLHDHRIIPTIA